MGGKQRICSFFFVLTGSGRGINQRHNKLLKRQERSFLAAALMLG